MAWIWFFTCCGRGRTVDRFYLYLGLGQWLIPQPGLYEIE